MARTSDYILSVGIVLLLILAAVEYVQIATLQTQVSQLQDQVQNIPNDSGQIAQLQQEINQLSSRLVSTSTQAEAIRIFDLCVSATTGCQTTSAFTVTVANNCTVAIPVTSYEIDAAANGSASYAFASFPIPSSGTLSPGGPAQLIALASWSYVTNKTGSFTQGQSVKVSVCVGVDVCATGFAVVGP